MLRDEELAALMRREITRAQGYDSDALSEKREAALEYYQGLMSDPGEGRSNIVSHDVADVTHALLAQFQEKLTDPQIEFPADSQEDEEQAQLESDAILDQIDRNDGWDVMFSAAHDALLLGQGWIHTYLDTDEQVQTDEYQMDAIAMVNTIRSLESDGWLVEVEELAENRYRITSRKLEQRVIVDAVAPEQVLFSSDFGQLDLQELRFIARRRLYTTAELEDMGLTEQEALETPIYDTAIHPTMSARQGRYAHAEAQEQETDQAASTLRETWECYAMIDMAEDGNLERYRVHIAGDKIISSDPWSHVPFGTGSPVPMPHRIEGQGMYELFGQVQQGKTHLLRQYMDNMAVMNRSRLAYIDGDVNKDDLLDARLNGVIRMRRPDAIVPLPSTNIGAESITGMDYLDKVRTQRGGAALDLTTAEMQIANSSATAAVGEFESKEKMAAWYCSNLVNTLVKSTMLSLHRCLRDYWDGQLGVRVRGRWEMVTPAQWRPRRKIRVIGGLSTSEKRQRLEHLSRIIEGQNQMIQQGLGGGVLTDINKLHEALTDYVRTANLGNVEQYYIDPSSEESIQAQQRMAQQNEEQKAMMQQMQGLQFQLEQQKQELDKYKHDTELRFKYYDANLDAGLEESKLTVDVYKNERDLDEREPTDRAANAAA